MDILFLAFVAAIGYIIILVKVFSLRFLAKTQVLWDVLFTFGLPFLFFGTYSGMAVAFISGVFFSLITYFLSYLVKMEKKARVSFGDDTTTHSKNNDRCSSSLRLRRSSLCN